MFRNITLISTISLITAGTCSAVMLSQPGLDTFKDIKIVSKSDISDPETKQKSEKSLDNYTESTTEVEGMFLHKLAQSVFKLLKTKEIKEVKDYETVVSGLLENKNYKNKSQDTAKKFKEACKGLIKEVFGSNDELSNYGVSKPQSRLCFLGEKTLSDEVYTYPGRLTYGFESGYDSIKDLKFGRGEKTNYELGTDFYKNNLKDKKQDESIDIDTEMEKGYKTAKVGTTENLGSNPTIEEFLSFTWQQKFTAPNLTLSSVSSQSTKDSNQKNS